MRHLLKVAAIAILAAIPALADSSSSEWTAGQRLKYSTKGHPKSKGVSLTISYPKSWTAEEGDRPNIVQRILNRHSAGFEGVLIVTKTLPLPAGTKLNTKDMESLFVAEEMKAAIPDGAVFMSSQATKIEALPAAIVDYYQSVERVGTVLIVRSMTLNFLVESTLVQVQFQVVHLPNSVEAAESRMRELRPLFLAIANSIVVENQWQ